MLKCLYVKIILLRGLDSNQRPQGYGPCELPLLYPAINKITYFTISRPTKKL